MIEHIKNLFQVYKWWWLVLQGTTVYIMGNFMLWMLTSITLIPFINEGRVILLILTAFFSLFIILMSKVDNDHLRKPPCLGSLCKK